MRIKHGDRVRLTLMPEMVGTLFCPREIGLRAPGDFYIRVNKNSKRQGWYPYDPAYSDFPGAYTYWAVNPNALIKLGPETLREIFIRELMS